MKMSGFFFFSKETKWRSKKKKPYKIAEEVFLYICRHQKWWQDLNKFSIVFYF